MKTGRDHLESLRDGREVYLLGEKITDVTTHPAFENAVHAAAHLYDFQTTPENLDSMTFASPANGDRISRWWQLPATYQDLVSRRHSLAASAETHYGFIGRSPDHVASCLAGMYMGIDEFESFDPHRAKALREYFEYARDRDLYLTYAIINPQASRSQTAADQPKGFHAALISGQDARGIIISGSKMLATSAMMANEVLVTIIQPLAPQDSAYAFSCAVPMNAPGLKILSRKSYEASAGSVFDNPLASRFDENDAVLFFDDVFVPWQRVFIAGDVAMCQKQFHATPAHVFQNYQCQIRLMVKLRFLIGVAREICTVAGIESFPQVKETLGQLAAEVAMVEALVIAMETKGAMRGAYFVPDRHMLYSAQVLTQQLYPQVIQTIRELSGGNMIMLPSGVEDFQDPEIARYVLNAQGSAARSPAERVKFFKLAWDAVGSEFASRHTQYEMFYAGAGFVTKGHSFRSYDWMAASAMVNRMLASYDGPMPNAQAAQGERS